MARREWTDAKRKLAVKLYDEGERVVDIATRVGISSSAVSTFLMRARPDRDRPGSIASERKIIAARLAERDRLIAERGAARTLTAEFFGDPLTGRSALDQKRKAEFA